MKRKSPFITLVLNIGSSSIKYAVFRDEKVLLEGYQERVTDYTKGIKKIVKLLDKNIISLDAIAHRVVHGGLLTKSSRISSSVLKEIENAAELAPLHNPPEIEGIKVCKKLFKIPDVAVFDTSFHHSIPDKAALYALPLKISQQNRIRRYGFHGTSHNYVSKEAAKVLGKPIGKLKLITCHLGNGASVCAVKNGKSVDTSMGFTPLEGLMMGTRSGDMDPAIPLFLQHKKKMKEEKIYSLLNHESGLKGVSGKRDMRDVLRLAKKGNKKARLAIDMYVYRITKYVGAYAAAMNGVDAIVFTAGIGEHSSEIRAKVMKYFEHLGVKLDSRKNMKNSQVISTPKSKVKVLALPTNEQLMMVREVRRVLKK